MNTRTITALIISTICSSLNATNINLIKENRITDNNKIISIPISTNKMSLILKQELTIDNNEKNMIGDIRMLRVNDNGDIFISDTKMGHIRVYDSKGNIKYDIGKRGQGPGEFMFIAEMQIINDKEILTYDPGNHRISHYDDKGLNTNDINTGNIPLIMRLMQSSDGNYVVLQNTIQEKEKQILSKFNKDMTSSYQIAQIERRSTNNDEYEFFMPSIRFSIYEKYIVWASVGEYKLYFVNENNETVRIINKEAKNYIINSETKNKLIKEMFEGYSRPIPKNLLFPKNFPYIDHFGISDEGIIYVHDYGEDEKDKYSYDIFDMDGKINIHQYLNIRISEWKNGKIYTVEEDELGNKIIKRYSATIEEIKR